MAPQASIATYFTKVPSSPAQPSGSSSGTPSQPSRAALSSTQVVASSPKQVKEGAPDADLATPARAEISAATAAPSSSPLSALSSGVKRSGGGLSDAAKRAIHDAAGEGPSSSKRQKVDSDAAPVADVFLKAAAVQSAKSEMSDRSSSREELRIALSSRSKAKDLLVLEMETMGEDWLLALQDEFTKPYFLQLKEFVVAEQKSKKVFPPADDIYSWSRLCPLKDVRVVIVGQDPYHDDGQAHGLAFSVRKGMRIPPSLRNIYKEMSEEIPGFVPPKHGDLTEWAKHGVLLLNTSLTVRAHEAASHSNRGWETFTAAVLKVITSRMAPTNLKDSDHVPGAKGVVFMAWGAHAQKMCTGVDKNKHLVLRSAHPSPLAAMRGFFGNGHFKKANAWLRERYGPEGGIDWKVLSADQ